MLNLYSFGTSIVPKDPLLTDSERFSIKYHDIFDYPLDFKDLVKWTVSTINLSKTSNASKSGITHKNGYYFLDNREVLIYKRILRKRTSARKLLIAKKAAKIISLIPTIEMIAITGSLAMENSSEGSDIDLMIVTRKKCLWLTRLVVHVLFVLLVIPFRRSGDPHQKDRLCLNMWLDESNLNWKKSDRNFYTAHEIAQIVPLVNKNKTYERFLWKNKWILNYWPNSMRVSSKQYVVSSKEKNKTILQSTFYILINFLEQLAFKLQYQHMKSKITREIITPTRALFHPQDWGKIVLGRLTSS